MTMGESARMGLPGERAARTRARRRHFRRSGAAAGSRLRVDLCSGLGEAGTNLSGPRRGLAPSAAPTALIMSPATPAEPSDAPAAGPPSAPEPPGPEGTPREPAKRTPRPRTPGEQVAFLSRLAGGLAHEIKNPLSTMAINLTLLEEEWTRAASLRGPREGDLTPREERSLRRVKTLQR